jgi:methanogenic corrinoid protein MtbC1
MREAWLTACLNFDEYTAQHILAQAFALFPLETVCFEILQKSLHQIGRGWYEGVVTVQQEHFASGLALRQLEVLLASLASFKGGRQLLIACPPKEQHTFSPLVLALILRRRNWNVVYLGANVPVDQLQAALSGVKPELVILTAQTLYTAGTMREMAELLRQEQVPLGFGGAVFSYLKEIRTRIPGYFLGTALEDAPELIEEIVQTRPPLPKIQEVSQVYRATLAHFRQRRPAIEAQTQRLADLEQVTPLDLSHANEDLGNNLEAALVLGSMELLDANMAWVQGLLINYHYRMPAEAMEHYIKTYAEAVKTHLDERGLPVRAWFEKLLSSDIRIKTGTY